MRLLVIIPAFNEVKNIENVVNNLETFLAKKINAEYVIINDGSNDGTAELLDQKGFNHLDLPCNMGLSAAVQLGFRYGCEQGFDCAIQFDGDGQHQAEYIKTMMKKIEEGYDIVIGSRFLTEKKDFSLRMIGSRFLTFLIRIITGKKITDPTSGMRMLNHRTMNEFAYKLNYKPEPDTLVTELLRGNKIVEIPVTMEERTAGSSIYGGLLNAVKYMLMMTLSILFMQNIKRS